MQSVFTQGLDTEGLALGCALITPGALEGFLALTAEDMESRRGIELLEALQAMKRQGITIELSTLDRQTNGRHTDYLVDAVRSTTLTYNYDEHFSLLREKAKRRRAGACAQKLIAGLNDLSLDSDDLVQEHLQQLKKLAGPSSGRTVSASEAALSFLGELEKPLENKAFFGIPPLDRELGGLFGGRLTVVGARPGTGKSALALSAALDTQQRGTVLFCSYEMNPEEIIGRAVARVSGVNAGRIARHELEKDDFRKMAETIDGVIGMRIHFSQRADTPAKVRAEAVQLNAEGELALIVIDYLQLMSSGFRAESRRVEVGQISRALKGIAMELRVPVLALSQLNRQSEMTASRAPTMAEMRESGDIEQDADAVILMYNPPNRDEEVRTGPSQGPAAVRFIIDKNRQGLSGQVIQTAFDGAHMRFLPAAEAA